MSKKKRMSKEAIFPQTLQKKTQSGQTFYVSLVTP